MSRKEIRNQLARMEQDRIFIRNAHIRQKIWGVAMSLICIALWAYIMTGGCKYVLYGVIVVPIVLGGCWLILTKKNIVWQTIEEIRKEEGHYDGT
jgi:hypothetical protein